MKIRRTSQITGETRTQDIDITPKQILAWMGGIPIQRAAPHLTADEREFIVTGITPEEWDQLTLLEEE